MLRVRQEGGGDRRICAHGQLALLIHGAPGAPSEAHTTTSDVTGECAAPLPSEQRVGSIQPSRNHAGRASDRSACAPSPLPRQLHLKTKAGSDDHA